MAPQNGNENEQGSSSRNRPCQKRINERKVPGAICRCLVFVLVGCDASALVCAVVVVAAMAAAAGTVKVNVWPT